MENIEKRQIVLDTETTGISYENGHKIIEIGAIEYIDRKPTGRNYHVYLDPEREVDEEAEKVHGFDREELIIKSEGRVFNDIAGELFDFLKGADLIIHNAPFDMGHLDAEYRRLNLPELTGNVTITDTLVKANNMYPGRRNNLDSLAGRLGVDTTARTLHGALLDAEILADVYLLMTTKQNDLISVKQKQPVVEIPTGDVKKVHFTPVSADISTKLRVVKSGNNDLENHKEMIGRIEESSGESGLSF
jgi:DNA polymerase-3 subunit epsilon